MHHERFDITAGEEVLFKDVDSKFLSIMNGKTTANGMVISPFSMVNDGALEMVL